MSQVKSQPGASSPPGGDATGPDPLARLYHMSPTAGVGTQEYVAINPTAIAALILGFGSVLVVLSDILLLIPLVGVICAIVALAQIRRSNQTQTGTGLAILGLLLSFGLGAGRVGYQAIHRYHTGTDERQIAQLMHDLGQDVANGQYDHAYQLFDDRFRERVDAATFANAFKQLPAVGPMGGIKAIEWNREPMRFVELPDAGTTLGEAMGRFTFEKDPLPHRLVVQFQKSDGVWRIADLGQLFPKKASAQQ